MLQGDDATAAQKRGTRRTLRDVLEALLRAAASADAVHHRGDLAARASAGRAARGRANRAPTTITLDSVMLARTRPPRISPPTRRPSARWPGCKQFILAVRQIRGEMDIAPSRKIPAAAAERRRARSRRWSTSTSPSSRDSQASRACTTLAAGESRAGIARRPSSASSRCWCRWPGLIDPKAEIERLTKRIAKNESDLGKLKAQARQREFRAQRAAGRGGRGPRAHGRARSAERQPRGAARASAAPRRKLSAACTSRAAGI